MNLTKFSLVTFAGGALLISSAMAAEAPSNVYATAPVFPVGKIAKADAPSAVPEGAQYRMRSGKSGVRYLACNEQRVYAGGEVELRCLTFSETKGWGKSLRWVPKYQVGALTGELPAEPTVSTVR